MPICTSKSVLLPGHAEDAVGGGEREGLADDRGAARVHEHDLQGQLQPSAESYYTNRN